MKKKVVVGLSGGVDSSVAAYLLKKQGYEVIGVTIQTTKEAVSEDALTVAKQLEIPCYVTDFSAAFQKSVIDYFIKEYQAGRTPNPCVMCNRYVKWEALESQAKRFGADYIATGHYARIVQLANGRYSVRNAATAAKDQTYALYNLSQAQLQCTQMPVGAYTKEEIRNIAKEAGLSISDKPDSMEICFIPDNDYAGYIQQHAPYCSIPGNFVDAQGNILGQHNGIIHYTVGQRKGLGLALGYPVFVIAIRPDTNEVVIGKDCDVFCHRLFANKINCMAVEQITAPVRLQGKIRYSHKGAACTVQMAGDDLLECVFDEPQRAVTPGQALVLYQEDYVFCGGTIV